MARDSFYLSNTFSRHTLEQFERQGSGIGADLGRKYPCERTLLCGLLSLLSLRESSPTLSDPNRVGWACVCAGGVGRVWVRSIQAETQMRMADDERLRAAEALKFQEAQAQAEANEERLKEKREQWSVPAPPEEKPAAAPRRKSAGGGRKAKAAGAFCLLPHSPPHRLTAWVRIRAGVPVRGGVRVRRVWRMQQRHRRWGWLCLGVTQRWWAVGCSVDL